MTKLHVFLYILFTLSSSYGLGQAVQNVQSTSRLALPNTQAPSTTKNYSLNTALEMGNTQRRDELNQNQIFELSAELDYKYQTQNGFGLRLTPRFNYHTGYKENQMPSSASSSTLEIKQAYFQLESAAALGLQVGAINQRTQLSSLTIGSRAFPALTTYWMSDYQRDKNWKMGLQAQVAIPSSTSMATETQQNEQAPTLNSVGVRTGFRQKRIKTDLQLNYFSFNNMPSGVAYDSSFLGNTTNATGPQLRSFVYEYKGIDIALDSSLILARKLKLDLAVQAVQNQSAPQGKNSAYRLQVETPIMFNRDFIIAPEFQYFRIESDAYIASFNSFVNQTNRIGYAAGANMRLMRQFKIGARGGEREVLVISPTQSRESWIEFKLETNYEI